MHGSQRRMPRQCTSPIVNSRPTSAFRSIPRVTTFRRWSEGPSGGSNDSHTSASIRVRALPGGPDGNVPWPVTCRSPSKSAPGQRAGLLEQPGGLTRGHGDRQHLDGPRAGRGGRTRRQGQRDVRGRHEESLLEIGRLHGGTAGGIPHHARGHAEHHHEPAAGPRDPRTRPRERRRVGDAREPEAEAAEPPAHAPAGGGIRVGGRRRQVLEAQLEDRGQAGHERGGVER